jgi:WD40 repeat protein
VFRHVDGVVAISFHPLDETHFLSGSKDELRIWNIPEEKVVDCRQMPGIVTAAGFAPEGSLVVSGCVDGMVSVCKLDGSLNFEKKAVSERVSASKRGWNAKVHRPASARRCCAFPSPRPLLSSDVLHAASRARR